MRIKKSRVQDGRKHQAILKAATRLFLKNGYSNTSMDAIATAASVTKQTVYSHYQSKDALFTRMVTGLCIKRAPSNPMLQDPGLSAEAMLFKAGTAFLDMFISKDVLAATRLVVSEAVNHPKLAKNYYESGTLRIIEMLKDFLDQQNRHARLHIPDTRSAASHLFSLLKGTYYIRTLLNVHPMPSAAEKEAHVRECVALFMRLYGGDHPFAAELVVV